MSFVISHRISHTQNFQSLTWGLALLLLASILSSTLYSAVCTVISKQLDTDIASCWPCHKVCAAPRKMWSIVLTRLVCHRWDNTPLIFRIPDELAKLLDCFLQKGHRVISPHSQFVFTNRQAQRFAEAASINHYWGRVSKRIGLPATIPPTRCAFFHVLASLLLPVLQVHFDLLAVLDFLLCGPQSRRSLLRLHQTEIASLWCRLRHIFVDERRSLNRTAGPSDAEAAMVMGNSTRAWDRYYDMRFQRRGAEAAVNAMPGWRQNMLAGQGSAIVEQSSTSNIDDFDVTQLD